jgi:hypothetical protein
MKLMLLVSRLSRLLVACSAAALVARGAVAQTVLRTLAGSTGEKLGAAFANAGDVNGDNWDDYLVGAPNANSGTGIVVCVSGKYLATAIAPATLYSIGPSVPGSAGSKFGSTIAALGDVNADGAIDFAVGAPYHDDTMNGADCGAVFFLNGATHALPSGPLEGTSSAALLGWSLSPAGDMNGDTRGDVIVAAPGGNGGAGYVHLVSGGALAFGATGGAVFMTFGGPLPAAQFGYAVLGDLDLDADGQNDIVVTAPYADQGVADRGFVRMYSGAFGYPQLGQYWGAGACALGRSLAGGADCDGDARPDLVVGAFKSDAGTLAGKAVVLSSSRIIQNTPPFEIYTLAPASVGYGAAQFGASVAVASDLNLDGTADILVGAPGFNTSPVHGFGDGGAIAFFSGATGARLGWYRGADFERLGSATLGALEDFDADGYPDVIVARRTRRRATAACSRPSVCSRRRP